MRRESQRQNRTDKVHRQKNNLVYRRTEIDTEEKFDVSKVYYVLISITVIGIAYLVFFSGAFNVNQVNISGTKDISSDDVKANINDRLGSEVFKNNILLLDTDIAGRELKKKYALKNIKIKKHYPSRVDVVLDEYVIDLNWLSGGKYYYIDEKGKAVGVYTKGRENIPIVEDKKNVPVEVGKSMVTVDFINFIKYLNQNFSSVKNAKISKIEINESFNEINVYSSLGFYIIFDTTRDPSQEIKNLNTALVSKDLSGKKVTYLDMRIKNKVFYK